MDEFVVENENSLTDPSEQELSPVVLAPELNIVDSSIEEDSNIVTDVQEPVELQQEETGNESLQDTSISLSVPEVEQETALPLVQDVIENTENSSDIQENNNQTVNQEDENLNETVPVEAPVQDTLHNIDDIYTILDSGINVNIQNQTESDTILSANTSSESETEITLSNIKESIDSLYILQSENQIKESEFQNIQSEQLQSINDNLITASNNNSSYMLVGVSLLASILGGMVAIGFLKGLR